MEKFVFKHVNCETRELFTQRELFAREATIRHVAWRPLISGFFPATVWQ